MSSMVSPCLALLLFRAWSWKTAETWLLTLGLNVWGGSQARAYMESYEAISGPLGPRLRAWPPTCQGPKGHPWRQVPTLQLSLASCWAPETFHPGDLPSEAYHSYSAPVCLTDYYSKMLMLTHRVWSKRHIGELYMKRNIYSVKKMFTLYLICMEPWPESWRSSDVKIDRVFHGGLYFSWEKTWNKDAYTENEQDNFR